MNKLFLILFFTVSLLFSRENISLTTSINKVYMLPDEQKGAKKEIIDLMEKSKRNIVIAMYNFSYKKFAKELIKAKKRGVDIYVVLDKHKAKDEDDAYKILEKNGIKVKLSKRKMHIKVAIFDEEVVVFGSSNWTKESFKKNFELIYKTNDKKIVEKLFNFIKNL